jgi:linoleate 10R-lipoxygenase
MQPESPSEGSSSTPHHQNARWPGVQNASTESVPDSETFRDEQTPEQAGVIDGVKNLSTVMHMAARPLPTETGNGSYIAVDDQVGSLWADIRALGIEDASTIKDLIEMTARGRLIDDKSMLMERLIRVIAIT